VHPGVYGPAVDTGRSGIRCCSRWRSCPGSR
jgi:hypothetical protein